MITWTRQSNISKTAQIGDFTATVIHGKDGHGLSLVDVYYTGTSRLFGAYTATDEADADRMIEEFAEFIAC